MAHITAGQIPWKCISKIRQLKSLVLQANHVNSNGEQNQNRYQQTVDGALSSSFFSKAWTYLAHIEELQLPSCGLSGQYA
jgi:hypothetical protein